MDVQPASTGSARDLSGDGVADAKVQHESFTFYQDAVDYTLGTLDNDKPHCWTSKLYMYFNPRLPSSNKMLSCTLRACA